MATTRGRPAVVRKAELGFSDESAAALRLIKDGTVVQAELPAQWDLRNFAAAAKVADSTELTLKSTNGRRSPVAVPKGETPVREIAMEVPGKAGSQVTMELARDGRNVSLTVPSGWSLDGIARSVTASGGRTKVTFVNPKATIKPAKPAKKAAASKSEPAKKAAAAPRKRAPRAKKAAPAPADA